MAKPRLVSPTLSPQSSNAADVPAGVDAAVAGSVVRDAATEEAAWRNRVMERSRNVCGNCGGDVRLQVHFVVPIEAGGSYVDTNGYVLCRGCEMAREAANKRSDSERRPINFWVSHHLYSLLDRLTQPGNRFTSMGGLIRYLISFYCTSPTRFDDLPNYQDRGTDSKVNAWVAHDAYTAFKAMVDARGMTVTDALKGLILLYAEQGPSVLESSPTTAATAEGTDE